MILIKIVVAIVSLAVLEVMKQQKSDIKVAKVEDQHTHDIGEFGERDSVSSELSIRVACGGG